MYMPVQIGRVSVVGGLGFATVAFVDIAKTQNPARTMSITGDTLLL